MAASWQRATATQISNRFSTVTISALVDLEDDLEAYSSTCRKIAGPEACELVQLLICRSCLASKVLVTVTMVFVTVKKRLKLKHFDVVGEYRRVIPTVLV